MFKCPKCRGGDFTITESIVVNDWIAVERGRVVDRGRGEAGFILGYSAECGCGHHWRMRNKTGSAAVEAAIEAETS